jgi:hypothetical protein
VALVGLGLCAAFLAGALASPFETGRPAPAQSSATWRPRAVTLDGESAERPFAEVMTELAETPPWQRSARTFSAAEIADLLGRPSSAAIAPTGRTTLLSIKPLDRPQICAQYLARNRSWSLIFCS